MLRRNVPILIDSLLDTTCNSKKEEIIALWSTVYLQIQRNKREVEFKSPNWESCLKIQICSTSFGLH